MAKKFKESHATCDVWDVDSHWQKNSDLRLLLTYCLPDSSSDGMLSYTSVMSLGLLLCVGSIYDKAKVLYQLVSESSCDNNAGTPPQVSRNDEYLSLLLHTMIEFATTNNARYHHHIDEKINGKGLANQKCKCELKTRK